jgi:L-threonylcarbamoyladenylate synthase
MSRPDFSTPSLPGVLRLAAAAPRPGDATRAAAVLKGGGVMVFPTETFYGLGGNGLSRDVIERIFRLKGRQRGKPLSLVVADTAAAERAAASLPGRFARLAENFWPGPLTLVLPASPAFPDELTGGTGTVAVRVPGHEWLRAVLSEAGLPLIATSANLSGAPPIVEGAAAVSAFRGRVDLVVDAGRCPGGRPSTVLDLTREPPRILRRGAVPAARLAPILA